VPEKNRPRKGSLGFSPRKRATSETPRFRSFPEGDEPGVQGFVGYKAGMTHVIMIDDKPDSPTEGMEVSKPVTVIETPRLDVKSVRIYEDSHEGLRAITEVTEGDEEGMSDLRDELPRIERVSLLVETDPSTVEGVPRKETVITEFPVASSPEEALDYAEEKLGEQVGFADVFQEGNLVDVAGVTKGDGIEGPVKRWGIKIQDRKSQRKGKGRHIGNLGPWHPTRVRWQVPQAGQKGYHRRTELNKRVLKVGDDPEEINPEGGFVNYGEVENDYVLIKGSVPGPTKRMVGMRKPMRPKDLPEEPTVKMVSTASKQGA